jgi:hypothetical protein
MSTTNDFVRNLMKEGKTAKEIRNALGRGAHFALPKVVREIGAKPSVAPDNSKGYDKYDDDTTFTF